MVWQVIGRMATAASPFLPWSSVISLALAGAQAFLKTAEPGSDVERVATEANEILGKLYDIAESAYLDPVAAVQVHEAMMQRRKELAAALGTKDWEKHVDEERERIKSMREKLL
jgi:predicted S18 family serine protease